MRTLLFAAMLLGSATGATSQEMKTANLYVSKISCGACAALITKSLRNVPGVSKVDVDVEKKEVLVVFDPAKATVDDLTAATAKRGYPSSVRKVES